MARKETLREEQLWWESEPRSSASGLKLKGTLTWQISVSNCRQLIRINNGAELELLDVCVVPPLSFSHGICLSQRLWGDLSCITSFAFFSARLVLKLSNNARIAANKKQKGNKQTNKKMMMKPSATYYIYWEAFSVKHKSASDMNSCNHFRARREDSPWKEIVFNLQFIANLGY